MGNVVQLLFKWGTLCNLFGIPMENVVICCFRLMFQVGTWRNLFYFNGECGGFVWGYFNGERCGSLVFSFGGFLIGEHGAVLFISMGNIIIFFDILMENLVEFLFRGCFNGERGAVCSLQWGTWRIF